MKKYIAPEVEIKKFNVENIMAESGVEISKSEGSAVSADNGSLEIEYNALFGIN